MAENRYIEMLRNVSSVSSSSLENVVPKALLIPIVVFFTKLGETIAAFLGVPISITSALGEQGGNLVASLIGGPARILDAGAAESAESLTGGVWAQFGPFAFVVAVAVLVGAAFLVSYWTNDEDTGNVIPLIPFDLPLIGNDEEE